MTVWTLGCIVFDDTFNHYAIWPPIPRTIFIKHCRVEIISCPFVLFHNNRFFNVCCLFHQWFSAAYLLKIFLLPQRAHTTLFIRCDKPELTRWCQCLCSLYAGIQMSPDEVVAAVTVVAILSQKALLMCSYTSALSLTSFFWQALLQSYIDTKQHTTWQ